MPMKVDWSSHWYDQQGNSRYDATLREARKEQLLPSPSGVANVLAKPGIQNWKLNEMMKVAYSIPVAEGETRDSWETRVADEFEVVTSVGRNLGTEIHDLVEDYLTGTIINLENASVPAINVFVNAKIWIDEFLDLDQEVISEAVVVNLEDGYAGRLDILSQLKGDPGPKSFIGEGKMALVDLKTQNIKEYRNKATPNYYDEWKWQLAAYWKAYETKNPGTIGRVGSFVVSTNPDWPIARCKWYTKEELEKYYEQFKYLLGMWRIMKNFPFKLVEAVNEKV